MANNYIPNELYNKKTLFSLGGASLGVWLFTTVIGNVFNFDVSNYKWVGLIVAIFLSFVGGFSIGKLNFQQYTIIFFNGLLIYVTACGIDSINHSGLPRNKNQIKTASIIPFTGEKIWWAPKELTDSIIRLEKTIKLQNKQILISEIKIKRILDSCSVFEVHLDKQKKIDYEALYNQQLQENKKLKDNIDILNMNKAKSNKIKGNKNDTLIFDGRISDANILMLKKTSKLCDNLVKKLDSFNSTGRYNPGTYSVSFLQKDIFEFKNFLNIYITDIDYLLNKK
jgi:hypothetical protein